jgi:hypothetical protein
MMVSTGGSVCSAPGGTAASAAGFVWAVATPQKVGSKAANRAKRDDSPSNLEMLIYAPALIKIVSLS